MPIFIPIGHRCNSIRFLRQGGFYTHNSPFDWSIMSLECFIKILGSNFENIFNDLYDFKSGEILFQRNHSKFDKKKFSYYLFSNHYKTGSLNLNYWDGNYDLYYSNSLVIPHYDMTKLHEKEKLQQRLDNMLQYPDKIYFYISIVHNNIDITLYYQQLLDKTEDCRFFIVITIDNDAIKEDYAIEYKHHILYIMKVPSLNKQYQKRSKMSAENDTRLDKNINWPKLAKYIKSNFDIEPSSHGKITDYD